MCLKSQHFEQNWDKIARRWRFGRGFEVFLALSQLNYRHHRCPGLLTRAVVPRMTAGMLCTWVSSSFFLPPLKSHFPWLSALIYRAGCAGIRTWRFHHTQKRGRYFKPIQIQLAWASTIALASVVPWRLQCHTWRSHFNRRQAALWHVCTNFTLGFSPRKSEKKELFTNYLIKRDCNGLSDANGAVKIFLFVFFFILHSCGKTADRFECLKRSKFPSNTASLHLFNAN